MNKVHYIFSILLLFILIVSCQNHETNPPRKSPSSVPPNSNNDSGILDFNLPSSN